MAWKKVKVTEEELRVIGLTCEFYRWEKCPDTPETQAAEEDRKA